MHKQLTERLSGIYELKLYQNKTEIRVFFVRGNSNQRSLLIDTGYHTEENIEILNQVVKELQISYQDLDVFLTHKHHDHTGLASHCASQGASIFMNPAEDRHLYDCLYYTQGEKSIEEQKQVLNRVGVTEKRTPAVWESFKAYQIYQQTAAKNALFKTTPFSYQPIFSGQTLSYGAYTFQTISLPGHTFGQLGLYDEEHRLVFSGDHIIDGIVPIVGTSYINEHLLEHYFKSLDLFRSQYRLCTVLPAHGEIISNPALIASNITADYRKKLLKVQQILENSAEALTVQEAAFRSYGVYNLPTDSNTFFKIKSIISKTFTCLEYLYDQKYCDRLERDGMMFYH